MNDYDAKYEEYKKSLLQNHWFIKKLHEKYHDTIDAEGNYIDGNGVFSKVGILSGVCGVCFWFFGYLEDSTNTVSIIARIVITIVGIACFLWAMHIVSKFKEDSGKTNFYAFRYYQYFKDHVQEEKDKETKELLKDMLCHYDTIRWRADSIQAMSEEDVKSLFLNHIKKMGDYEARHQELENYDRFAEDLKNDYHFNAEIQRDIDKYI